MTLSSPAKYSQRSDRPLAPEATQRTGDESDLHDASARFEVEGDGVHAVPVAGGRAEPIGEHVTEVRTASGAAHLGALHAEAAVGDQGHGFRVDRLVEARPTTAR